MGLLSQVTDSMIANVETMSVVNENMNGSVVNAVTVVNERMCVENAVYESVSVSSIDENVVNGRVECEDYAVNKNNVKVHHVIDEDNANMNNVRKGVQEKPETRELVNNVNPEGKHNDEKTMEEQMHEKPEEKDYYY
jgi:hypothetical protein